MLKFIAAAALLATPILSLAEPTNLVVNGSFESNVINNGSWINLSKLSGWTTGALGAELRNGVAGNALDGHNFVELDTTGNSSISQSIATVAGQWYALSFDYSNRPDVASASNGLAWRFGSASGNTAAQDLVSGDNHWLQFNTLVQATSSSMLLSFAATGTSDSLGSSLDRIAVVTAVPEPESYALMLAGLAAIAFVAKRRKTN